MQANRKTKFYSSRSEADLDVQLMRAQGWVLESIEESASQNYTPPRATAPLSNVGFLRRLTRFGKDEESTEEQLEEMRDRGRIEVTYRRA